MPRTKPCLQNFTNLDGTIVKFSVTGSLCKPSAIKEMLRKSFLQITVAGALGAVALLASDFWKSKDSSQWTNEEVVKLLTDSPWAKQITVTSGQQGGGQRRGGGMGRRGGGMGGGYPGGGGGGYPGGGGGGYPGGGGGGRGGGGDSGSYMKQEIILRWESAMPVQEALKRQHAHSEDEGKAAADPQKYYVVSMLGFNAPSRRNQYDTSDGDSDRSDKQSADDLRNRFLDTAQLIPKSKVAISAEDVQFEGRNGSIAIRFLFPKTFPLSKDDKEIDFHFQYRGVKFEHKFKLGDMVYQGQVAL